MKRTIITNAFVGSAAAGMIVAAVAAPAFAQQKTYPAGTDCSSLSTSADRTACTTQMNESRQNMTPGSETGQPDATSTQPATNAPGNGSPSATGNGVNGTGATGTGGTTGGGTSQ